MRVGAAPGSGLGGLFSVLADALRELTLGADDGTVRWQGAHDGGDLVLECLRWHCHSPLEALRGLDLEAELMMARRGWKLLGCMGGQMPWCGMTAWNMVLIGPAGGSGLRAALSNK